MTENEWERCTDPEPMMGLLQGGGKSSGRKCRLFACACVRRIWPLLPGPAWGDVVKAAERFADGEATVEELASALAGLDFSRRLRGAAGAAGAACWYAAFDSTAASRLNPDYRMAGHFEWGTASRAAYHARKAATWQAAREAQQAGGLARHAMRVAGDAEYRAQADLLRDLFGPAPFRLPTTDPVWRTPAVLSLAQVASEERIAPDPARPGCLLLDPARLAVLADALEESGADADLIGHLREPVAHIRGCWCIDLLLSRA